MVEEKVDLEEFLRTAPKWSADLKGRIEALEEKARSYEDLGTKFTALEELTRSQSATLDIIEENIEKLIQNQEDMAKTQIAPPAAVEKGPPEPPEPLEEEPVRIHIKLAPDIEE